jgi:hypothetical protein
MNKKNSVCLSIIAAMAAAVVGGQLAAQTAAVELPVTKVVLYSSGVGYFQHSGSVQEDATVRFSFKTDQINDLLKSMVLRDFGGGSVGAVTYASQDPVSRALKSFAVDLSDKPGMAALLDRLRGAKVTVMAPQAISGTILGIEQLPRTTLAGGQAVETYETMINLITADGLKSLPASSIVAVKLADPRLNDELDRALALIISAADTQRRAVDVQFAGKGSRKVAVEYIAEAPVWKTSYRLDLSSGGFLQGWAIIENTSDADWKAVNLSLASGSPVSFTQDLYTPLYVTRPAVAPMVQAQVTPRAYDEGMGNGPGAAAATGGAPAPAPAMAPAPKASLSRGKAADMDGYAAAEEAAPLPLSASAALPGAQGSRLGELFNFTVKSPVSLARRQSAMLPLLSQDFGAEKVSIYNKSVQARNPMNGAILKNSSGLRLPPGPITVFDGGMYAGDALLETFGENDQRLISYAVDLDTLVDPGQSTSNQITKVSIVRGVLTIQRQYSYTQTWKVQNKSARDKTLIIEYPKTAGRSLVSPKEPMEQTAALYRFRVAAPKSALTEFSVKEQMPGTETIALLNGRVQNFLYYMEYDKVGPAVKAALQKAADLRQKADSVQQDLQAATQAKAEIENGQGRLRENIETVGRDTPQGQRYLQKLLEGEDQIDQLAAKITELQARLKQAQAEFENYLKNLQVE